MIPRLVFILWLLYPGLASAKLPRQSDYTALVNFWGHTLDGYGYTHDPLGLRTNITRTLGLTTNTVGVGFDNIGQITSWSAKEGLSGPLRLNEQDYYAYDKAGNLWLRTNGGLTQTFNCDVLNQLTNITRNNVMTVSGATPAPATNITVNGQPAQNYGDFTFAATNASLLNGTNTFTIIAHNAYGLAATNTTISYLPSSISLGWDSNGNLTNDGTRSFAYSAENQLTNITVAGAWKTDFIFDGLGRRRVELDYGWQSGWVKTNELHFIYDGWLLVQVRDGSNNVLVTYTRGLDMSGSLAGAGGIGGLLARTDGNGSTFYHADGAGNITGLMDGQQNMASRNVFGPFGNVLLQGGPMAGMDLMGFSSMPQAHGIVFYPRRPYLLGPQRGGSPDPLGQMGGMNSLYGFVGNNPISNVDPYGLTWAVFSGEAWGQLWNDAKQAVGNFFLGNQTPQALDPNSNQALRSNEGVGPALLTDAQGNAVAPGDLVLNTVLSAATQVAMLPLGGPEEEGAYAAADAALQAGRAAQAAKACKLMDPSKIRFSQDSISPFFKGGRSLEDLIAGLKNGTIKPQDVPPIRVFENEGQLFTLDNRRLEAFRQAGVPIPFQTATPDEVANEAWKLTTQNGGASVRIRGQ